MVTAVSWVLLSYRVPREPSAPRIAIWRSLKRLGVAQVGDGLVALPADARTREHLEWVAEQVQEAGGTTLLWTAVLSTRGEEACLISDLVAARTAEYEALLARIDEPPADSSRLLASARAELRRIERRDYFPAEARDRAVRAIQDLAARLTVREGVSS